MNYYIFIVEGAHDVAILWKVLEVLAFKNIQEKNKVADALKPLIKETFPFCKNSLNVFNAIPFFFKKDDKQVCIINANGEKKLLNKLDNLLDELKMKQLSEIKKIIIFADGDLKSRDDKIKEILESGFQKQKSFSREKLELHEPIIKIENISIPCDFYIFPNNCDAGRLEDILLQTIENANKDLLHCVSKYINDVPERYKMDWSEENSKEDKTKIACIGNVLLPGVASGVFIKDSDWISEESIAKCDFIKKL